MKHKRKYKGLIVLLLALVAVWSYAQEVEFTVSAPKYVKHGQQFQLTYSANKEIGNFKAPSFNDFQFLGGPSTGSSTSIQMINGKTTRNTSYTYTYYLRASKTGKFTLDPATATYKGKPIQTNSSTIEVLGNNQSQTQSQTQSQNGGQSSSSSAGSSEDLYMQLHTNKRTAYVGEQITAWVKIYTQVNITGLNNFKEPGYNGFYKQDVDVPELRSLTQEKIGNDLYHTGLIRKVILYPQKTGEVVIEPCELNVQVQQRVNNQPRSVFDDFFGSSMRTVNIPLKSKEVKLKIKPLPGDGKPENFSGAVGSFKMKATSNTNSLKTNDALTLKVTVSGTGNIKLIEGVEPSFPSTFDAFDPVIKTNINKENDGLSGTKTFEYTLIPRHAGDFTIRPFTFSYFNPSTGKYVTLQSQSFDIHVEKGEGDSSVTVISGINKQEIEVLGTDINFIATDLDLKKSGSYLIALPLFYLVFAIPFLLFILILVIRRKQIKEHSDRAKYLNKRANKLAKKRLKKAKEMLQKQEQELFYEEVTKALWGYLSEKINIPVAKLSVDNAREYLIKSNSPEELTEEFVKLIQDCEFARYAPGASGMDMDSTYERASKTILKIDQKIKL